MFPRLWAIYLCRLAKEDEHLRDVTFVNSYTFRELIGFHDCFETGKDVFLARRTCKTWFYSGFNGSWLPCVLVVVMALA